ncbi:zinc finger protein 644a [Dunckerocampus dactyliophorus]|uniref:zinc finger protein 644a n=1 Tax=Dunckerocampus dactyliophorus TaxID=161453 RepID=UPI0024067B77|nr:zinc finger protein 644a [Dunckerocampus dactyliophorus]
MAAEMSCLAGVDGDDKDAEPDINALILLQESVKMAEESTSCNDSLDKQTLKQSTVLDVLSNTDMLSPIGLGNGLSLQEATQADELNSMPIEKDEEKSITQLKTVQEIDTAGIWGFDVDLPANSSDDFSSPSDIQWDPHKEFMQLLWENHNDSSGQEPQEEVHPLNNQNRRKCKMDMVVMMDPSEDVYSDLSRKSPEDFSHTEDQVDSVPLKDVRQARTFSKLQTSQTVNVPGYPNGTMKAIKQVLCNVPGRHSHEDNPSHGLSSLNGRLTVNSHSEEKASRHPCSKCKLIFKKAYHLQRHMKTHEDPPNNLPKTFMCRECGDSFRQSSLLIEHMRVHHEKRSRLPDELKGWAEKNNEDNDAKLFCPQCPFRTNCPNTFVQHAKTHDKRKFQCDKCSYRTESRHDLLRHDIVQHTVNAVRKQIRDSDSKTFSCHICSYKAFSKNVFKNHLLRRHQQEFEEYESAQYAEKNIQPSEEQHIASCTEAEDAELTSKIMIKNQVSSKRACLPAEPSDISDLFKSNKIRRGLKSQLTESKLDKSINVLLSRQKHGRKTAVQRKENACGTSVTDWSCEKEGSDQVAPPVRENTVLSPNGLTGSSHEAERVSNCNLHQSPIRKSPSKRKMSTPYRNTSDQDSCFILPKPVPSPKRLNQGDADDYNRKDTFHLKDTDANIFDNGVNPENHNLIYTYSRRMSIRGALQASKQLFEKAKNTEQEQSDPTIKEECIETEVFQEAFDSHPMPLQESIAEDMSELELDRKSCPYCPAVFQSGVGLSNHVRGHLHRVGLTYKARHVLTPEQVVCKDRKPKIPRKITSFQKLKKVLQLQPDSEETGIHSCPLCGDSFDNRKGQSNHVRGHLKKIGRGYLSKNRSPLIVLKELMRNKKEYLRAVEILGKKQNNSHYGANHFMPTSFGIHQNDSDSNVCTDVKPLMPVFSLLETDADKRQLQTKLEEQESLSDTTALIGILKKRKCQEDSKPKGILHISRYPVAVSSNSEHSSGPRVASSLPIATSEKGEFNRKACIHCNASFHSGVSLSNHLRACVKRKRTASLEGTAFDCKARRQRLRQSSKKKMLPLTQTPEEMYRLTCRFCDLVFQGPLSVQEDWVKHLQRHIMNTGVPHTGLGMVEVTSPSTDLACIKTDQENNLNAAQATS